MNITKFGHSSLLVEEAGLRVLTDPGNYSTAQNEAEGIEIILITHEHQDHIDVGSLRAVLAKSAGIPITSGFTRTSRWKPLCA